MAVVPCLSLFDSPDDRENGSEKKEETERKTKNKRANTYTSRSATPDRPPPARNTGIIVSGYQKVAARSDRVDLESPS